MTKLSRQYTGRVHEVAFFFVVLPQLALAVALPSVPAPRDPVTNIYNSVAVVDDYQWLEKASAPEVRVWTRMENERTRAYYAQLPFRDGIAQQLAQLRGEESARYAGLQERKGRIFALRFKPPAQQPVLVRLSSLEPRPCGGRCSIPMPLTRTARPPSTGTWPHPMGGWSRYRCPRAAASKARCTSSRSIPAGS